MCNHTNLLEFGTCECCDDYWRTYYADARFNRAAARKVMPDILRFIRMNPGCTGADIYSDPVMEVGDIHMYIALHWLIEGFQIKGPDPYAPAAPQRHDQWQYYPLNIDAGGPEDLATR